MEITMNELKKVIKQTINEFDNSQNTAGNQLTITIELGIELNNRPDNQSAEKVLYRLDGQLGFREAYDKKDIIRQVILGLNKKLAELEKQYNNSPSHQGRLSSLGDYTKDQDLHTAIKNASTDQRRTQKY